MVERARTFRLSPSQFLIISFAALVGVGALLLMLPLASSTGQSLRPMDALFTATSAVCVTGLIVLDTPADFSLFGQIVILALIQIGGLGYMTIATVLLITLGRRIGLRARLVIQETLSAFSLEGLIGFIIGIVQFAFLVELFGAVLLTLRYFVDMDLGKAIYYGIFHSISAFNNAGFSLFSNSMIDYRSDLFVNVVIMTLIILGGVGFLVYQDVLRFLRKEILRLSTHTKVVLVTTIVLILFGWAGILLFEHRNPQTLQALSWADQGLSALFQTVSGRTAGFSSIDVSLLGTPTLYLLVLLMFVGGGPGSAAGGIKVTTLAIMVVSLWSTMRGHHENVTLFHRRLPSHIIAKAFFLAAMGMILVTGVTLLLLYSEGRTMLNTLFEVTSAAGTVGMSIGDGGGLSFCALFSDFGKGVIVTTMFLGRIGPLAIGITSLEHPRHERVRYPEGKVIIG